MLALSYWSSRLGSRFLFLTLPPNYGLTRPCLEVSTMNLCGPRSTNVRSWYPSQLQLCYQEGVANDESCQNMICIPKIYRYLKSLFPNFALPKIITNEGRDNSFHTCIDQVLLFPNPLSLLNLFILPFVPLSTPISLGGVAGLAVKVCTG